MKLAKVQPLFILLLFAATLAEENAADKKPEKQPEEKSEQKILDAKKPDEKKPDEKKPDEEKPDGKKPDEKKPDEKKPDEKKPDEKKPDEKKPDEKKSDEKKPDEKKPDEKKPDQTRRNDKDKSKNKKDHKLYQTEREKGEGVTNKKPDEEKPTENSKDNEVQNEEPCEGWCMFGKVDPALSVDRAVEMENRRLSQVEMENRSQNLTRMAIVKKSEGRQNVERTKNFGQAVIDEQWGFYNKLFKANPLLYGPHMYHLNPKHGRARPIVKITKQNLRDDPIFDKGERAEQPSKPGLFASDYLPALQVKAISIDDFMHEHGPSSSEYRRKGGLDKNVRWTVDKLEDRYMRGSVLDSSDIDNVCVGMKMNQVDNMFLIGTTQNAQQSVASWLKKTTNPYSRSVGFQVKTSRMKQRKQALNSLLQTMLHTYQYGKPKVDYRVMKFKL